jgi:phosphatidylinositol alpha-mannosyltransferase
VRIAQICPYSLSVPGGVQSQVLGLARALRDAGDEVAVLAPCDGDPPDPAVVSLGRSVGIRANGSVAPLAPHPAAVLRTVSALRSGGFDVVHVHEPFAPGPSLAAVLGAPRPIVGTFHRSGPSAAYRALAPLARAAARRLAVRCAVSEEALLTAERPLGGSLTLTFNAVEADTFASAAPRPKCGPVVAFVGRHEPRKGLSVLLEAFARLPGDARLWVAGDGPQTGQLRSASPPRVEWLGRVGEEEKASLLKAADVACAPSLGGESFGLVLLEAMAAGAAVVASDLPGYRSVASDGVDSLLVPPGDAGALARAMQRLLEDEQLRRRLAAAGEHVAAAFSMKALAARYGEIYAEIAGP